MAIFGLLGLVVALAAVALSIVLLLVSHIRSCRSTNSTGETLAWAGGVASLVGTLALVFCCGLLIVCFLIEDPTIRYVLQNQSHNEGVSGLLFRVSGLWAGREGSLLFWATLIALYNAVVAVRTMRNHQRLDVMALLVSNLVLLAFISVTLFSESNMPFAATEAQYFNSSGELQGTAKLWGMNQLLEHWAMAIHPPTLFVGYAGLTLPFAYAIATLILKDSSDLWVRRSQRYAMFSWLFLGIGIGLGAVWAYVVLGWGGYWGWDPVENASLLSWMVALALIHSFTIYRQQGAFKRWSIMCACLAFAFVVVGTLITRSGIVDSVHAFAADPLSLELFSGLIIVSVLAGIIGLLIRWKTFAGQDVIESLASRNAAYFFNNLLMVLFTFLLTYLTVASALPSFLPFGGMVISAGTYNAIARPLGVLYCLILAICPLLSWGLTDKKTFLKRAKIPFICALVLFIALLVYFILVLYPNYQAIVDASGRAAEELLSEGAPLYYNGLAVVGLLVASLLFFNTLYLIQHMVVRYREKTDAGFVRTFLKLAWNRSATVGGYIAHLGIAVILVGLIGSSMYVTEKTGYLPYNQESDTAEEVFTIEDYELRYAGSAVEQIGDGSDILYQIAFDVYRSSDGGYVGHVAPSVQLDAKTQQTKLNAGVLSFIDHDLFVVYRGVSDHSELSLDARINPLINCVWIGFFILMTGTALAFFGRRGEAREFKLKDGAPVSTAELAAHEVERCGTIGSAEYIVSANNTEGIAATDSAEHEGEFCDTSKVSHTKEG